MISDIKYPGLAAISALILVLAESVGASAVNVSLADNPGFALVGPAGGEGNVWNTWKPLDGPLLDADGNPTSIEVLAEGEGPYGDWWCDMPLLTGGLAARDGEQKQIRISGLNPGSTYDLYVVCARGDRASNTMVIPAGPNSSAPAQQADNRFALNGSSWVMGENYILMQDLIPDVAGTITFGFEGVGTFGVVNSFQIVEMGEVSKTYSGWASEPAQGFTPGVDDDPFDDADRDGIGNLLEFATNGNPLVPSSSARPGLLKTGAEWAYEYDRRDSSRHPGTEQVVEYSNDLVRWTPVTVPTVSSGVVTVSDQGLFDRVRVRLPSSTDELFVRLRVRILAPPQNQNAGSLEISE